jgi:hypothetical protein
VRPSGEPEPLDEADAVTDADEEGVEASADVGEEVDA